MTPGKNSLTFLCVTVALYLYVRYTHFVLYKGTKCGSLPLDLEFPRATTVAHASLHTQGLPCNRLYKYKNILNYSLSSPGSRVSGHLLSNCLYARYFNIFGLLYPYSFPTKHSYRSVVDERVSDLFHHIMSVRPSFNFKSLEAIFCVLSLSLELHTFFMHPSIMFSYQLCDDMKNIPVTLFIHLMNRRNM